MIKRYDAMFAKQNNDKTFWTKCGVAFLNKAETGYNLILDSIPAPTDGAYRISLFEPKENTAGTSNSGTRPSAARPIEEDDIPF